MQDDKNFRLPSTLRPTRYETEVSLKPDTKTFSGVMRMELSLQQATSEVALHAIGLQLQDVEVEQQGEKISAASVKEFPVSETVRLQFDTPLSKGTAVLRFSWNGKFSAGLRGLYASGNVVSTQFEAADARRMFPCFDEPSFKARWKISLRAPKDWVALSNGVATASVVEPQGTRLTHFAETEVLSSYLLAVACGPLKAGELETVDGVPLQTWSTLDKAHLTGFGQQVAREVLPRLRAYFGLPYAFGKLDQVGVPDFEAGAMENAGLIIYRELLLLLDEKTAPLSVQKRVAEVVTHELAHQWFGNWVTMEWWDDLWLNEAFATWMAYKIVDAWRPEWRLWTDFDTGKAAAMALDALKSTHPIRCDVKNAGEAGENFDVITYEKGGGVLRMLEGFLGENNFQEGIRRYMVKHAKANATADDLWNALSQASGQPVLELAQKWIGQSGFPLLKVMRQGREITFTQQRFYSEPGVASEEVWPVPLVLRYADATGLHQESILMRERNLKVTLPGSGELHGLCANAGATGFYRVAYEALDLAALAKHRELLQPSEKVALLADVWACVRASKSNIEDYLNLAETFAQDEDYTVVDEVVTRLSSIGYRLLEDEAKPSFEAWVHGLFAQRFEKWGWESRGDESQDVRLLRQALLRGVGLVGRHPQVSSEAARRMKKALEGETNAVPTDLLDAAMVLAARQGDVAFFENLENRLATEVDPAAKRRFLNGLTAFETSTLAERGQALLWTSTVPMQEVSTYVSGLMSNPVGRPHMWQMMQSRWQDVLERTGGGQGLLKRIVESLGLLVTPEELEQVRKLFSQHPVDAAKKAMEQTFERLSLDVAFRERVKQPLRAWLEKK